MTGLLSGGRTYAAHVPVREGKPWWRTNPLPDLLKMPDRRKPRHVVVSVCCVLVSIGVLVWLPTDPGPFASWAIRLVLGVTMFTLFRWGYWRNPSQTNGRDSWRPDSS